MIYEFSCKSCSTKFDVWKPVSEFTRTAACANEECTGIADLVIHPPRGFINEKVEHAEYNPGLGCVVKNRAHRADLARARGLIEVGNEKPETLHKEGERKMAEKLKYEDV